MKKLIVLALVVLAGLIGYHFFSASMKGGQMPQGGGAMPANVATVEQKSIVETEEFSGRFNAVNNAEIRPQVSGTIEKIFFKEGDMVKAGAPLFALDGRTYRAALLQAQAGFTEAQAALERGKVLFAENAISKKDMDSRTSAFQNAAAALTDARVNVDYATIKAPIDGKIGRADVTVGNVVAPGAGTALTTIQSISPIYVDFDIDEQTYLTFMKMKQAKAVAGDDTKSAQPTVAIGLADNGLDFPLTGVLQSTDNRLDPATGSLRARAVLDNADDALLPGLFARVKVSAPEPVNAVLVNDSAIGTDQSKRFVYVLGADNKAVYREVKVAGMSDGLRVVKSGLQGGEHVVVGNLMKVMPGAPIAPTMVDMNTLTSGTVPAAQASATEAVSGTVAASGTEVVSGTVAISGTEQ